jgi:secreted protein with Ig-like and vWFA domain
MIAVTNAATNAPICDAQVTASGTSGEFSLDVGSADGGACQYTGPSTTGSFTITISKSDFQTATLTDVSGTIQTCDGPKLSSEVIPVKLTAN